MVCQCAQCGKDVEVKPGQEPQRTCGHDGAAIVAQVEARCKGGGGVKG